MTMPGVELSKDQVDALNKMHNGCILNGRVGSGKSRTGLAYYYVKYGGRVCLNQYIRMISPPDLYIITTAKKRDNYEWEEELSMFYLSTNPKTNIYNNKVVIDSWNNIKKYVNVKNAFFIFDEQKVVGYGVWVQSFITITKNNPWILLSATPGDNWMDYLPVFIANGYYKNKTDFCNQHVIWAPYVDFPKISRYYNEGRLLAYKKRILVPIDYRNPTTLHHETILCDYNKNMYSDIEKNRWNPYLNKPIENATEYCLCLRRLVNSDPSRQEAIIDIIEKHKKAIIFYNYDYELEILRNLFNGCYLATEWNGHLHQKILSGDKWVYLTQYAAGSEGWNCITCNTIIFYSQSYSYKMMEQACGRIDRRNTPYKDLYYYHLKSNAKIDKAINNALNRKKKFNEKGFAPMFNTVQYADDKIVQSEEPDVNEFLNRKG